MKRLMQILVLGALFNFFSCGKEFLDIRRDKAQVVPSTIKDFQGLLDNNSVMNSISSYELSIIGSDEYQLSDGNWNLLTLPYQKNGYVWAEEVYERQPIRDWDEGYRRILIANMALEGIENISPTETEQEDWNNVKGSALFLRALNHYQLAQLFGKPYNINTAKNDLGIPLRLESDITLKVGRGNLQAVYNQVIKDLEKAIDLLPNKPLVKYRPSKAATYALLARVYLQIGDYKNSGLYADKTLQITNELIDYNTINLKASYSFPSDVAMNPEILFFSNISNIAITGTARFDADPELLVSYEENDLRKQTYFFEHTSGRVLFKGSYRGAVAFFTGIAVDEVLLIRAECYARENKVQLALDDLNSLLVKRYNTGSFVPKFVLNNEEALRLILKERRKELVLRGLRWEDLRRLNQDSRFEQTLTRELKGEVYELKPNSNRYVWPIPDSEIDLSGLEQNMR